MKAETNKHTKKKQTTLPCLKGKDEALEVEMQGSLFLHPELRSVELLAVLSLIP